MRSLLKSTLLAALALTLIGCEDKAAQYANPPSRLTEQIDAYYPLSLKYVRKNEAIVLEQGKPLSPQFIEIARKIGIKHPEKVRIHYTEELPLPENESLLFQMQRLGLDSPYLVGMTFGYGIWIENRGRGNKQLIAHELIHVKQIEDKGLEAFTKDYLLQLLIFGYAESPIEIEAYELESQFL